MSAKPQKPRKSKPQKVNLTRRQIWERILKDVEKDEIPLHCIDTIRINITGGTEIEIDINQLISEGNDPEILEEAINAKLEALDEIIDDIDFMISVEKVAKTVQPYTDQVLKNL
jgi:hypothetical protein